MFVSEASRLAVLVRAADVKTVVPRFRAAVVDLLRELGVSEDAIHGESEAMKEVAFANTRSRSVLGTMNDYFRHLRWVFPDRPSQTLGQHALDLSETPCGPLKYARPRDVARALLGNC